MKRSKKGKPGREGGKKKTTGRKKEKRGELRCHDRTG